MHGRWIIYHAGMCNKGKKKNSSTSASSESEGSDTEQRTGSALTNFPHFILIDSTGERKITSLPPFVIKIVLLGIVGEPKRVFITLVNCYF